MYGPRLLGFCTRWSRTIRSSTATSVSGLLACAVFLDVNGVDPTNASNDGVYELVMRVGSEPIEVAELAALLRGLVSEIG